EAITDLEQIKSISEDSLRSLVNSYLSTSVNKEAVQKLRSIGIALLKSMCKPAEPSSDVYDWPKGFLELLQPENTRYCRLLFDRFIRDSVTTRCFLQGSIMFLAAMTVHMFKGHELCVTAVKKYKSGIELSEIESRCLSLEHCLGQEQNRPAHENTQFLPPFV